MRLTDVAVISRRLSEITLEITDEKSASERSETSQPAIFSPGDRVQVRNADYAWNVSVQIQYGVVESVDTSANTVTLHQSSYRGFEDGSNGGQISRIDLLDAPASKKLV